VRIVRYYPRALVGDGGMTSAVKKWSQGFVDAGAEAVIAFDEGVDPPARTDVEWLPVRHAGRPRMKLPVGLADILRGADVLVLHSGWTLHNLRAAAVARRTGVSYILEPRGAYDPHIVRRKRVIKKAWWLAWERRLVTSARAIHVFFESERAHLAALGYTGPVVVASNGVDAPTGPGWDGGSGGYVLWLGRFDPEHKGLDLLLRALRVVPPAERPHLRLNGPDWRARKSKVVAMVRNLGLQEWVTVGEAVYGDDKRSLLRAASGFVYPSRWDACPNSTLEAVSLGVPTLVTPYPLGRFFAARGAAVLAQPDPAGLADGLRRLQSPEVDAVGPRGSEVVRRELGWDSVARSWLEQVEALL
jgi:glycosyltransferase involved in cell wall biosynthesis